MVATCAVGSMLYVLPMLLGRTYDMQHDTVGIDIYDKKDIDDAKNHQIPTHEVTSNYMTIENFREKKDFLGVTGELAIKISSGLLNIKGAGEYLRDTSNSENSVEILIKLTFTTVIQELSPDAKPLPFWELMDPKSVGTHVVTSLTYGGVIYASINFVALKSKDLENIKAQVSASISKSGAFDAEAQGKLEKLAQNISSKAKLEIDYYGNVPLAGVPTTIEGLINLVSKFKEQVEQVNDGIGVPICAKFRALSEFSDKFTFLKNQALVNALNQLNYFLDNLRTAKSLLRNLVSSLPEKVSKEYLNKIIDFSGRLTKTLNVFYDVIGSLDLQLGSEQLTPAINAFDSNSPISGDNRYTKEVKKLIKENEETEDPNKPRGHYTQWGKRTCGNKASNILYIGYMASFMEQGIGAGTEYQCLPENPHLNIDSDATGLDQKTTKLAGVRYTNMSVFKNSGKHIQDKVVPCVVCETPMRPTVKMFPSVHICPGDWVPEYNGYLVANYNGRLRSQVVCVDVDPDTYNFTTKVKGEPYILPVKMGSQDGSTYTKDASVPCAVCSK